MFTDFGGSNSNSRKGKNFEDGNSSRNVPDESFPTGYLPQQIVSQSPADSMVVSPDVSNGSNLLARPFQSFTSLLNGECDADLDDSQFLADVLPQAQPSPVEKSQTEILREFFEQHYRNTYKMLLKKAEEKVAMQLREKDMQHEQLVRRIIQLEIMEAQYNAEARKMKEKMKEKELQVEQMLSKVMEANHKVDYYRSEIFVWKEKSEKLEQKIWQMAGEGVPTAARGGVVEDGASSFDVTEPEEIPGVCKVCGKRVAGVLMWPCKHICVCTRCNANGTVKVCPVCKSASSSTVLVYFM